MDAENVLEHAVLDKGYDADRIRERLNHEGIEAVILPIYARCKVFPYHKELYRERNRVERFFNKIKNFCRTANNS